MAPEATAPPSRRELRERSTASNPILDEAPIEDGIQGGSESRHARPSSPASPLALTWVDDDALALPPAPDSLHTGPAAPPSPGADLLATAPRRKALRPSVVVPASLLLFVLAAYVATTLLWPLHAIAPEIDAVPVQPIAAAAAAPVWPDEGSAAVSVAGMGVLSSSDESISIASITKLVTAMVVLEQMPLAPGEQGPDFSFTADDRARYWQDRAAGESALDVPVGGTLTQYQMLEGLLVGSANNYADRLSSTLFPSDAAFADAARSWLSTHGISGISIDDPSGILAGNAATSTSLIALATTAMANPVIAEIVAKPVIDLPGAGRVENTNELLADPGVVGLKTGTLDSYNLLAAKDVTVGGVTARIYGSVLGQPNRATRDAAMRALFAQVEAELQPRPSVVAGTLAGRVTTRWGESAAVVTAGDAAVTLWNGAAASASAEFSPGDEATQIGATVGTLTVAGPVDIASVDLQLAEEIEEPTALWRLTHPLELFGLTG